MSTSRVLLAGGYTNQVWKVRGDRGWTIEKRYAPTPAEPNPMYPNLPDHEAAALRHLAGTGTAPEMTAFVPASGKNGARLEYRYVAGTQWRRGSADVARLLHRLHTMRPPRGLRLLHRSAADALAHADAMVADAPATDGDPMLLAVRPAAAGRRPLARRALVHTDCGLGNLVRSRQGLVLIDWQCPGLGDPVEDLACFLSPAMMTLYGMAPHGRRAVDTFLAAYDDGAAVHRYRGDGAAWHYRIAAYCRWRHHRLAVTDPDVSARYGAALAAELELLRTW